MQAIIFTGLQASGKSTFYRRNLFDTHVRVNLDMLKGSRSKERKLLEGCIAGKTPCVVDNTNLTVEHRKLYIQMFKAAGYEIKSLHFNSPLDACLARNETREDKAPIPKVALIAGDKRQTAPEYKEGFDQISMVTLDSSDGSYLVVEV